MSNTINRYTHLLQPAYPPFCLKIVYPTLSKRVSCVSATPIPFVSVCYIPFPVSSQLHCFYPCNFTMLALPAQIYLTPATALLLFISNYSNNVHSLLIQRAMLD